LILMKFDEFFKKQYKAENDALTPQPAFVDGLIRDLCGTQSAPVRPAGVRHLRLMTTVAASAAAVCLIVLGAIMLNSGQENDYILQPFSRVWGGNQVNNAMPEYEAVVAGDANDRKDAANTAEAATYNYDLEAAPAVADTAGSEEGHSDDESVPLCEIESGPKSTNLENTLANARRWRAALARASALPRAEIELLEEIEPLAWVFELIYSVVYSQ
jgi:hypothetical protein